MPTDRLLEEEHRNEDLRAEDDLLYLETTAKPAAATAATEADASKEFEVLSSNLLAFHSSAPPIEARRLPGSLRAST